MRLINGELAKIICKITASTIPTPSNRVEHIQPENLQRQNRQFSTEEGAEQNCHRFWAVDWENEADCFEQIFVHRSPFFYSRFDRRKVIIGEDRVGGFLRNLSTAAAGDRLGCSDAIAGNRFDLDAAGLTRLDGCDRN